MGGHVGVVGGAVGPRRHHGDEVPAILQTGEYALNRRQTEAFRRLIDGPRFHRDIEDDRQPRETEEAVEDVEGGQ